MKTIIAFLLFSISLVVAQQPPIWRNPWSTNQPPAPITGHFDERVNFWSWTFDTNQFVITNGNIGIGNSKPEQTLTIGANIPGVSGYGFSMSSGESTLFLQGTNNNGFSGVTMYDDAGLIAASMQYGNSAAGFGLDNRMFVGTRIANAPLTFITAGLNERARISATGGFSVGNTVWNSTNPGVGNVTVQGIVGIGTATPVGNLNVSDVNPYVRITGNTDAAGGNSRESVLTFRNFTTDQYSIGYNPILNGLVFANGGTLFGSPRLILKGSGNFGIGEFVPGSMLSVVGNAAIGVTYATLAAPSNSLIVEGFVGVGTNSPQARLHVVGNGANNDLQRWGTTAIDPVASVNTNGVIFGRAAGLQSPINAFGSLMLHANNSVMDLAVQNTFYQVTNYNTAVTNWFYGLSTEGSLTNLIPGYYGITLAATMDSTGNANHLHVHLFTNNVECDVIGFESDNLGGSAQSASGAGTGIVYAPAGTRFDLRVANKGSTGFITNVHTMLRIGAP